MSAEETSLTSTQNVKIRASILSGLSKSISPHMPLFMWRALTQAVLLGAGPLMIPMGKSYLGCLQNPGVLCCIKHLFYFDSLRRG